ncbi:MAG: trypsin-like peptidase domain-containing protein [Pseudomonadota bacterium]
MRRFITTGLLISALSAWGPAQAQDIVGFDRSSFGQVVLKRNQSADASGIELELAVGAYNNESIRNYSPDSIFAQIGLSVGRLDILTDNGVFPCTAFIVSDRHLLTNHHCVPGILENEQTGASRIDAVQFVAGYTQQGVTEGTRTYTVVSTPIELSRDLDYAVLEVIGDPSAEYGSLDLADRVPQDGDPYWVIGHPMGEAQRISREKCRANKPALSGDRLLHTCDTLPGNSGSPVIDASLQKVVGLHHAGSKRDSVNFAIPMQAILENSAVLKAAATAPAPTTPAPTTQPQGQSQPQAGAGNAVCDALYTEAKSVGKCFAYKAYVQNCSDHAFAPFAKGFIAEECQAAPQPVAQKPVTQQPVTQPTAPTAPVESGTRIVSGNYTLSGSCYVITASRATVAEAQSFANQWFPGRAGVRIFRSENGFHAIALETVAKNNADWRINQLKAQGAVPSDSYCSSGRLFRAEVLWSAAAPVTGGSTPTPSARIMYVDNNSDGALNVRPGPGTNYPYFTEILSGSQVQVLGSSGNWSNVVIPDGRQGWVYTPLLTRTRPYVQQCSGQVVNLAPRSQYNAATGAGFLNVRAKPRNGRVISEVYLGDQVRVVARKDGWARLECLSGGCLSPTKGRAGVRGWSSEKYLNIWCK